MAYYVSVVPPTSATATGTKSIANDETLLQLYINNKVGAGTLIQILEVGPRLTLVWSI